MAALDLQAFDRSPIPNEYDAPDPDPGAVALGREPYRLQLAAATQLAPPTGRYNCHGLVFGSRRVAIGVGLDVDVDIKDLLRRDGYSPIEPRIDPQVGDIAVYVDGEGAVEHTGIVSRWKTKLEIPECFIWSAWGGLGEFEHHPQNTPYYRCTIEYWSL